MANFNDQAIRHFLRNEFHLMPADKCGLILDLGYGSGPYKHLYKEKFNNCISGDYNVRAGDLDLRLDASSLPFPDAIFDVVLMSEVIEHVEDFRSAISEVCRVLKPGGVLLITWPFNYMIHEVPYDFCRLTEFGMENELQKSNANIECLVRRGGVVALLVVVMEFLYNGFFEIFCRIPLLGPAFRSIKKIINSLLFYIPYKILLHGFDLSHKKNMKPGDCLKGVQGQMAHWTVGYCARVRKAG